MKKAHLIVQALVALSFGAAGAMKSFQSIDALNATLPWTSFTPAWVVRLAGGSELLAGMILGAALFLLKLRPLAMVAAGGLVLVMVLAAGLHAAIGDFAGIPVNAVLGAMAGYVAWQLRKLTHGEAQ